MFLHMLATINWFGGVLAITVLIAHIARKPAPALVVSVACELCF